MDKIAWIISTIALILLVIDGMFSIITGYPPIFAGTGYAK